MLKIRLNLRIVVTVVACLAVTAMFSGCGKDDKPDNTKAPGAVKNLSVTEGNEELTVEWEAPADDGGAAITGYEVTMDNWTTKATKTASQLAHTYTGLTNETEYSVKVRAVNAKGAGAATDTTATPSAWESYYSIDADGVKYAFGIERNSSTLKAAYTPKVGDNYKFAVMYPNGQWTACEGVIKGYKKEGSLTTITVEHPTSGEFRVHIDGIYGWNTIDGNVPGPGRIVSLEDFRIILESLDYKWYRFFNDTPLEYLIMIDPLYWGVYEWVTYNTVSQFYIAGNSVSYYTNKEPKPALDLMPIFEFAWTDYRKDGKLALYGTDLLGAVIDYLTGAPIITLAIKEIGQFNNVTCFMYQGAPYLRLMPDEI